MLIDQRATSYEERRLATKPETDIRYFETGPVNPPSARSGWGSRARVRLDASCVLCICTAWPRAVFKPTSKAHLRRLLAGWLRAWGDDRHSIGYPVDGELQRRITN